MLGMLKKLDHQTISEKKAAIGNYTANACFGVFGKFRANIFAAARAADYAQIRITQRPGLAELFI